MNNNNSHEPAHAQPAPQTSDADAAIYPTATGANAAEPGATAATSIAGIADEVLYTLTVQQSRALFAEHHRKVPAERTLQGYCQEGAIVAKKFPTSFGTEWLINEASLLSYIVRQPQFTAAHAPHTAPHAAPNTPQAPQTLAESLKEPSAEAPQSDASAAAGDAEASQVVGETRTLAQVLIENSRLLATVEGKNEIIQSKDQVITELKDDRQFLREELTDRRRYASDLKGIASEMLGTLKAMALRNALPEAPRQPRNVDESRLDRHEDNEA